MARWRSPRVLLASCVAIALLLVLADVRGSALPVALRSVAGAVAGPPERVLAWVRTEVAEWVGGSAQDAARIAELEAELAGLRAEAGRAAAGDVSDRALRELAAYAPAQGFGTVPARVMALSTPQDQVLSAALSVGSSAGVSVGQAVVALGGLAGVVDVVSPQVATFRLVGDPATAIAVRVAASGEAGILRGDGAAAQLELLDPLGRMEVGDLVTTMGTPAGDRLPADLPIGRIASIEGSAADLTRRASVHLAVDHSTLDRVGVLVPGAAP